MVKIAINGFGRIGRMVAREMLAFPGVELVAVNDLFEPPFLAYLFNHDSVHGPPSSLAEAHGDSLHIGKWRIHCFKCRDPAEIAWNEHGAEIVVESTGFFTKTSDAAKHIRGTVKKVIISAPSDDAPMFVMGVNEETYKPEQMHVVSNASCTTNCLAPLTKVLHDTFGVESGLMTTIHAVTVNQPSVDGPSRDWRLGRSALCNIIPSTTGAAKAVGKVIPALNGKLTGMSVRVPVTDGSLVDLTVNLARDTTYEEICAAMKAAAAGHLKGVVRYTEDLITSTDIQGERCTTVFDAKAGIMLNPRFVKVVAWYDNEIAYSHQLVRLALYVAGKF
jgi:glyceraldehyde 3-phosphate dehydrogenase